jgi:hypothetical protein
VPASAARLLPGSARFTTLSTFRKLPLLVDKQKVELSGRILAGDSNEEIMIYGKSDCWNIERNR